MLTTSVVYQQTLCTPKMNTLSLRDVLGLIDPQEERSESSAFEEGTF